LAQKSYPQVWEIIKNLCFAVILVDTKIVFIVKQYVKCSEHLEDTDFERFNLRM
jgi:hypothetical protein